MSIVKEILEMFPCDIDVDGQSVLEDKYDNAFVGIGNNGMNDYIVYDDAKMTEINPNWNEEINDDDKRLFIEMIHDSSEIDGCLVIGNDNEYQDAIIASCGNRVIYDYDLLVQSFCKHQGWDEDESVEWIDYNVYRSLPYFPNSPIIVRRFEEF